MKKIFFIISLLTIFVVNSVSATPSPNIKTENAPIKKIIWTGCGITKKAFMAEIAAAYRKKYGVEVILNGGGATKGIRATKAGESHIGGTCRIPMHSPEEESMLLKMILVAWDALVVVVNKDLPVNNITRQELKEILTGKITTWNQLEDWHGNSSSGENIKVFTRHSKISGVGYTLRKMLFDNVEEELSSHRTFPSSGPLEKAIEQEADSFGVTGISSARKRNFKILTLDGIKPDYETIKSGHYTMYRPLYLTYTSLYRLPENERKEVRRFLEFIKSDEAAEIIKLNQVVPFKEGFHLMKKRKDIFGS